MHALVLTALLAAAPAERELIVLVLIDAMRADHVGAYGYSRPTTPNLDELATRGTRYTRAYVNAPWTRPSTASFLTGLNASRHRTETEDSKLPAEVVTLAQKLAAAGWKTAGFTANGNGGSLAGLERGFHVFEDPSKTYTRQSRNERCAKLASASVEERARADCKRYNGLPTGEFLVGRALDHLRHSRADKEFLFVFLVDPHDPYEAPPALEKMFLGDFKGTIRRRALWERDNNYPGDERFSMMAVYDAGIRYADQALGELLRGAPAAGFGKVTWFVTADHGEGFGEHGFYLHAHHFWEEVIHVPLIAVGPAFSTGVDPRIAQSIDVAATILSLAGVKAADLPGRALTEPAPASSHIISEYNEYGIHRQAAVGRRYKVIWQRPADEAWYLRTAKKKEFFPSVSFGREVVQVFDLTTDPQEKHDLATAMPAEAAQMLAALRAFVGNAGTLAEK
ncbi:MAG: sulfatase [Deltaproteobacteria bacterium]|nr:sulfatase [Deltaproteobacteria bacterium]